MRKYINQSKPRIHTEKLNHNAEVQRQQFNEQDIAALNQILKYLQSERCLIAKKYQNSLINLLSKTKLIAIKECINKKKYLLQNTDKEGKQNVIDAGHSSLSHMRLPQIKSIYKERKKVANIHLYKSVVVQTKKMAKREDQFPPGQFNQQNNKEIVNKEEKINNKTEILSPKLLEVSKIDIIQKLKKQILKKNEELNNMRLLYNNHIQDNQTNKIENNSAQRSHFDLNVIDIFVSTPMLNAYTKNIQDFKEEKLKDLTYLLIAQQNQIQSLTQDLVQKQWCYKRLMKKQSSSRTR